MVECDLAKVDVAGSNPVSRSKNFCSSAVRPASACPPLDALRVRKFDSLRRSSSLSPARDHERDVAANRDRQIAAGENARAVLKKQ